MIRNFIHIISFLLCLTPLQAQQVLCFPEGSDSHSPEATRTEFLFHDDLNIRVRYFGLPEPQYVIIDQLHGKDVKPDFMIRLPQADSSGILWHCTLPGDYRVAIWDSAFQTLADDTLHILSPSDQEPPRDYSGFQLEHVPNLSEFPTFRMFADSAMGLSKVYLDIWQIHPGDQKDWMGSEEYKLQAEWKEADFILQKLSPGTYEVLIYDRQNRLIAKTSFVKE